jgi:hypothetical protein
MRRFKHDALLPLLAAETVVTGKGAAGGGVDGDSVAPQHTLLLMPAVTDGSLQDVCDEVTHCRGRLPAVVLLSACAQAAAGLACMHAHTPPYAHRDVKPGNLLLMVRAHLCRSPSHPTQCLMPIPIPICLSLRAGARSWCPSHRMWHAARRHPPGPCAPCCVTLAAPARHAMAPKAAAQPLVAWLRLPLRSAVLCTAPRSCTTWMTRRWWMSGWMCGPWAACCTRGCMGTHPSSTQSPPAAPSRWRCCQASSGGRRRRRRTLWK